MTPGLNHFSLSACTTCTRHVSSIDSQWT